MRKDNREHNFFDCLAISTEWLIEVWALVRGLVILVLVLASILMNLIDTDKSPINKIFHQQSATK